MIPKKKLLSLFIGSLLLAGCFGRIDKKISQGQQESSADLSLFKAFHGQEQPSSMSESCKIQAVVPASNLQEARLVDIPIPLKSNWSDNQKDDQTIKFFTELTQEEIVRFYRREMDRLGWLEIAFFEGLEPIIIFKKPGRWLAISISACENFFWQRTEQNEITIQQAVM
jgi:hypothetical protein